MTTEKIITQIFSGMSQKRIGRIVKRGGVIILEKTIRSNHLLRQPPAICWDKEVLEKADVFRVKLIECRNTETNITYTIGLADFMAHAFRVSRGYGEQLGCCLAHWDANYPQLKKPVPCTLRNVEAPPTLSQLSIFDVPTPEEEPRFSWVKEEDLRVAALIGGRHV